MATTMIEYLAKKNNLANSLRAINSAILSGVEIVIGYTSRNLRYGCIAEPYLHIGGKSVEWSCGYADPKTVAAEIMEHAAEIGREANIGYSEVATQRGQLGCAWWRENTHLNLFEVTRWIP